MLARRGHTMRLEPSAAEPSALLFAAAMRARLSGLPLPSGRSAASDWGGLPAASRSGIGVAPRQSPLLVGAVGSSMRIAPEDGGGRE